MQLPCINPRRLLFFAHGALAPTMRYFGIGDTARHFRGAMISTTCPVFGSILLTGDAAPDDPYNQFSSAFRYSSAARRLYALIFVAWRSFLRRVLRKSLVDRGISAQLTTKVLSSVGHLFCIDGAD
jgi:hypothetical protein